MRRDVGHHVWMASAPATNTPTTASYSATMDVLRFVLAVLVIYSHAYALLAGSDATEPLYRLTSGQLTWGGFAVDAFFILSGYLITQSFQRSASVAAYMQKRVLRIYPGFIVAVAVGVLIVAPLSMDTAPRIALLPWLIGTLNLRGYEPQGVFADLPFHTLNGSLWSIAYEFTCYLGVAVLGSLGLLTQRRWMRLLWLASVAVSIVFVVFHITSSFGIVGRILLDIPDWARLLPYYLAGTLFCLEEPLIPMNPRGFALALLALAAGALVPVWGVALIYPGALTYALMFVARSDVPKLRGFTKYGDFSYGIYLYAFPVQQLLVRYVEGLSPWSLFALALPPVLLTGVLSFHLVEKPCMALRGRLARARTADPLLDEDESPQAEVP